MVGRMPGKVTCQIRRSLEAPSILAASYNWGSMVAMAARYRIVPQPALCQMEEKVNTTGHHPEWAIK
ncbi:hypothetical protein D3C86_2196820 [compost metagenome]